MSYLQYLSVVSFRRHNPTWEINLFIPTEQSALEPTWSTGEQQCTYDGEDYLERTKGLCAVVPVDFNEHELSKPRHEVQRSDIIRWFILHKFGGVWSDIDILYVRPVSGQLLGPEVGVVYHNDPYIGFLAGQPGQQLFGDLYNIAKGNLRRNVDDTYQSLGGDLFRIHYGSFKGLRATYPDTKITNFPMDLVYPYLPNNDVEALFFGEDDKTTAATIGIHWYNGSSRAKDYQNNFEEYRYNNSLISRLVREYV